MPHRPLARSKIGVSGMDAQFYYAFAPETAIIIGRR
jgi:hypothetical protein